MKNRYVIKLMAGSRPNGLPAYSSEAERLHSQECTNWLSAELNHDLVYAMPDFGTFIAMLTDDIVESLLKDSRVLSVSRDFEISRHAIAQVDAPAHLTFLTQASGSTFEYILDGYGVDAYVMDTGMEIDHDEFGDRARHGFDAYPEKSDDQGDHGTAVASFLGGRLSGVAKAVSLINVRVLDPTTGSGWYGDSIMGMYWIAQNHNFNRRGVVNMSYGGYEIESTEDDFVQALINDGFVVCLAAGNDAVTDRSSPYSPAAINVGACDLDGAPAAFTNFGEYVSVFAPGVNIVGASIGNTLKTWSGTSFSAPLVAGLAACYLSLRPGASPAEVKTALLASATHSLSPIKVDTTDLVVRYCAKADVILKQSGEAATSIALPTLRNNNRLRFRVYKIVDGVKVYLSDSTMDTKIIGTIVVSVGVRQQQLIAVLDTVRKQSLLSDVTL